MIYGIGVDLVSISRVGKIYKTFGENFINKILTIQEKDDFSKNLDPKKFLAKKFAAKEAFVKSLGKGFQKNIFPSNIGTHSNEFGKPILHYSKFIKEILERESISMLNVSISDEKEYAIAMVTLESY